MKELIKPIFLTGVIIFSIYACQMPTQESTHQHISLQNNSSLALMDKPIIISSDEIMQPEDMQVPILLTGAGDTIASQLDDLDGDGIWDELFFVIDLDANENKVMDLLWTNDQIAYPKKTSVRFGKRDSNSTAVYAKTSDTLLRHQIHAKLGYQPYQTDGPSFENDKAGFRHYFDGRNAKDYFGKKVAYMSPETVGISEEGGVEDNYHVMADWGRDVLSVNNSSGLGGLAIKVGEDYGRLGCIAGDTVTNIDQSVFEIVVEGPVRSILRFKHQGWHPLEGRDYKLFEEVSIWPGMYAFQGKAYLEGLQGDEKLLVGMVNSNTEEPVTELKDNDKYVALYTHDRQTYDKTWWLGLAVIIQKEGYEGYGQAPEEGQYSTSYYGELSIAEGVPVTYYGLGAWELSDTQFTDSTYFVNQLSNFVDQLAAEVKVTVE